MLAVPFSGLGVVWILIMNIAMINTCQIPISFTNVFQRGSPQAQCEHAAWLFFAFLFYPLYFPP